MPLAWDFKCNHRINSFWSYVAKIPAIIHAIIAKHRLTQVPIHCWNQRFDLLLGGCTLVPVPSSLQCEARLQSPWKVRPTSCASTEGGPLQIDPILCKPSMIPWGVPKGVLSFCSATWKTSGWSPKGSWPTRNFLRVWGTMTDRHGIDRATIPFRHSQSVRQTPSASWKLLAPHVEVGGSD